MKNPGDTIVVTLARDGIIHDLPVTLERDDAVSYRFSMVDKVTEQQRMIYRKWMRAEARELNR